MNCDGGGRTSAERSEDFYLLFVLQFSSRNEFYKHLELSKSKVFLFPPTTVAC